MSPPSLVGLTFFFVSLYYLFTYYKSDFKLYELKGPFMMMLYHKRNIIVLYKVEQKDSMVTVTMKLFSLNTPPTLFDVIAI